MICTPIPKMVGSTAATPGTAAMSSATDRSKNVP
jgi:hypothetical protein